MNRFGMACVNLFIRPPMLNENVRFGMLFRTTRDAAAEKRRARGEPLYIRAPRA
jgi:hypothetical protein